MANLVFCLMGPTASGKTELACELIKRFPIEIISVDSAMIYREMNIGTAKPDSEILAEAPHHLIDLIDPPESYSAASFCKEASLLCEQIKQRGKIPLLVGGTMMYFRAFQQGLSTLPSANQAIRETLLQQTHERGTVFMHQMLANVDPITAERLHPNDTQRIQRALEVYHVTNRPLSSFLLTEKQGLDYRFVNVALIPDDRTWLHRRIAERFESMLALGFIEEVEALLERWDLTLEHPSMKCVGYRQVMSYLQGALDRASLRTKGIEATRQLAKRQLTWLRHWPEVHSFSSERPTTLTEIVVIMEQILDNATKESVGAKDV